MPIRPRRRAGTVVLALAVALALAAPAAEPSPKVAPLPERLHETGLFDGPTGTTIAAANLPFSPQYPLWSDGTSKRRWLYLPPGASIDAARPDAFDFPPGTKAWKEFSFGDRVETRYLERLPDGAWRFATYVWNAQRTDATLAPEEGVELAVAGAPGGRYAVPSRNDCLACHDGGAVPILGFSALQLSPDRDPLAPHADAGAPAAATLATLVAEGRLRNLPASMLAQPPRIAARTPTERAALGYLHGNCGHCHADHSALGGVELALAQRASEARASAARTIASLLARDSRFRRAPGASSRRVVPGDPEHSVLAQRLRSESPLARMPPIGVAVTDDQGASLVERWIRDDLRTPDVPTPGENR